MKKLKDGFKGKAVLKCEDDLDLNDWLWKEETEVNVHLEEIDEGNVVKVFISSVETPKRKILLEINLE